MTSPQIYVNGSTYCECLTPGHSVPHWQPDWHKSSGIMVPIDWNAALETPLII